MISDSKLIQSGYDIINQVKINCIKYNLDYETIVNNHIFISNSTSTTYISDQMLNDLYNCCDIGINTCVGEGFGLCNLEHGSIGKPQIISGVGALVDIFNNDISKVIEPVSEIYVADHIDYHGGYIKICKTDDFVNGMIQYYDNKELYQIHGNKCRTHILYNYKWKNILDNLQSLLTNMNILTYKTKYGLISLYRNELYIKESFDHNQYWDETTLKLLKEYIDPNKNILDIGAHCGTSSIVYASYLNEGSFVYAFEPQKNV